MTAQRPSAPSPSVSACGCASAPASSGPSSVDNDELWERAERDSKRDFRAMDPRRHGLGIIGDFHVSSESGSGDSFGSWSSQREADVFGLSLGGSDALCSFEPRVGQKAWLVWCTHTSGDSFGEGRGHFFSFGAFRTERGAQRAAAAIRLHAKLRRSGCLDSERFGILDDDGAPMLVEAPWSDPFAQLQQVFVEAFVVSE